MNTIRKFALGALLILSPAAVEASPYGYGYGYQDSYRPPMGAPHYRGPVAPYPGHYRPAPSRYRIEMQAQIRLRQLGYYRGPIDGLIGRGTRHAIVRFQYDHRLRPTGRLDHRTLRALRIIR
jgi:hypothetical protein